MPSSDRQPFIGSIELPQASDNQYSIIIEQKFYTIGLLVQFLMAMMFWNANDFNAAAICEYFGTYDLIFKTKTSIQLDSYHYFMVNISILRIIPIFSYQLQNKFAEINLVFRDWVDNRVTKIQYDQDERDIWFVDRNVSKYYQKLTLKNMIKTGFSCFSD